MSDAPLMLGVSGARGIVGQTMTTHVARRFAACWGAHLVDVSDQRPLVCLGRDSRPSGGDLLTAAAEGLSRAGCKVVDLGIVATPTVGVMINSMSATGGVVVTASHNPTPWNGLKLLDHNGMAPQPELAAEIIAAFQAGDRPEAMDPGEVVVEARATDTHIAKVLGQIEPVLLADKSYHVVLDSINGAGCEGGRRLLESINCQVEHLGSEPTGHFWHEPEPIAANLSGLCEAVVASGADIGCAQDPDADRLALVDEQGRYIGEEYTLVLSVWRMLLDHPEIALVANLSTSRMIDDLADRFGATVHRSAVGEANVASMMRAEGAPIGGEGNGGVMLPAVTWIRDSLTAMVLVLDLMRREDKTLSALVDSLPSYVILKDKLPLRDRSDLDPALSRLRSGFSDARINDSDGVRIDFESGWAHVRPSNTEPIARIIVEASDEATAISLIERVRKVAEL